MKNFSKEYQLGYNKNFIERIKNDESSYVLHRILKALPDDRYWIVGDNCVSGDIVKRKNRMDIQIFQTAITSYFSDKDKDIPKLMDYAKTMQLEERVRQYTEVLL